MMHMLAPTGDKLKFMAGWEKSFISGMPVGFHYWSCLFYVLFDYHLIIYVGRCVAKYVRSVRNW